MNPRIPSGTKKLERAPKPPPGRQISTNPTARAPGQLKEKAHNISYPLNITQRSRQTNSVTAVFWHQQLKIEIKQKHPVTDTGTHTDTKLKKDIFGFI